MITIKMLDHPKSGKAWFYLSAVLVLFYLVLTSWANVDLAAGRFVLFMDELISFDGVKYILHPAGWNDFISSVTDGGDQRYGRSMWNSMALISFLPEYFFGEAGQIIASRMAQVVFLLSAFALLTITFVTHPALRFLLLASLLSMPFASYYISSPKPEPLQILFIASFLYFFKKNEMRLRGWYWILLGLAFGTKISALPIVAIFLFVAFAIYCFSAGSNKFSSGLIGAIKHFLGAIFIFLLGLGIAVPTLFSHIAALIPQLAISFMGFHALEKFIANRPTMRSAPLSIFTATVLVAANGLIFYKFGSASHLTAWFQGVLKNASHGGDSISVGFGSWMEYLFHDWMAAPVGVTLALIVICSVLVVSFVMKKMKSPLLLNASDRMFPLVVILSGLALNLAIFVSVHRLWGFYLFTGTILIVAGMFAVFESHLLHSAASLNKKNESKFKQNLAITGLLLVALISFFWWIPKSIGNYRVLANRTNSLEYVNQYKSYREITAFLDNYADQIGRRLTVTYDPRLFNLQSNEKYQINYFWGPYHAWTIESPDVIIWDESHTQKRPALSKDNTEYNDFVMERDGYNKYVTDKCLLDKCYQRVRALANGGEILIMKLPQHEG